VEVEDCRTIAAAAIIGGGDVGDDIGGTLPARTVWCSSLGMKGGSASIRSVSDSVFVGGGGVVGGRDENSADGNLIRFRTVVRHEDVTARLDSTADDDIDDDRMDANDDDDDDDIDCGGEKVI